MSPESLSLLGGPILGPVGPLMFVVSFPWSSPLWVGWSGWLVPVVLCGRWSSALWSGPTFVLAPLVYVVFLACPGSNRRPLACRLVWLHRLLLQQSRGRSVLLLFYFYVLDIFRMLRSASASCYLLWKSLTVSMIVFGVYNSRPAGAWGVLMLILSRCFKTLRNIPCLI